MFDTVILGAGGIKCFIQLGVLLYMENNNLLKDVKEYVGVSIGSLISLLLCSGYDSKSILDNFLSINFNNETIKITSLVNEWGFFSPKKIKRSLKKIILNKWGKIPTLLELYKISGIKYTSVVTNNNEQKEELINYETYPNMPCIIAPLLSMNIPIIFEKLTYNNVIYTDGVIALPYPSIFYDNGENRILCIHIIIKNRNNCDNIVNYLYNNMNIMTNQMKNIILKVSSDKCKFLFLETDIIDILGNYTEIDKKTEMYVEGYNKAKDFFKE